MSELTRAEWLVHRAICETEMDECAKERGACVWAVAVAHPRIEADVLRKVADEIQARTSVRTAADAASWLQGRATCIENHPGESDD